MTLKSRFTRTALLVASLFAAVTAQAADGPFRIGIITDMSGVYADLDGQGGAEAMRMAVEDFGGKVLGQPIEVLTADNQNKADIAATRAREWIDREDVKFILGGTNSAASLAIGKVVADKKVPYFVVGAGSSRFSNEDCNPYQVHYAYDTVALARVTAGALIKEGAKNWFFLTADYAFGHSLEKDASAIVNANGGKVAGAVRHPLGTTDFSSFLLQAQASGAQVLGLANAGADFSNSMKAANEFGVTGTMKVAGLLVVINDIHALGLDTAQGLLGTDSWYWTKSDETRAFAKRFMERVKRMPSSLQAADYSATLTYLNAVKAVGSTDPDKIMEHVRNTPINDMYVQTGKVRVDGRMEREMYLLQVKKPAESKEPWDYYNLVETVPGSKAFTSLAESRCPLVKK